MRATEQALGAGDSPAPGPAPEPLKAPEATEAIEDLAQPDSSTPSTEQDSLQDEPDSITAIAEEVPESERDCEEAEREGSAKLLPKGIQEPKDLLVGSVLDLETTGLNASKGDRIVQVAILRLDSGEHFQSYVNPGPPIGSGRSDRTEGSGQPERSETGGGERIHGISAETLKNAPSFAEILPQIERIAGRDPIIAHNAEFDMSFLEREIPPASKSPLLDEEKWHCSLQTARKVLYRERHFGLDRLAKALRVPKAMLGKRQDRHDALEDCQITKACWIRMRSAVDGSPGSEESIEEKPQGSQMELTLFSAEEAEKTDRDRIAERIREIWFPQEPQKQT